jgi:hypothetical protein
VIDRSSGSKPAQGGRQLAVVGYALGLATVASLACTGGAQAHTELVEADAQITTNGSIVLEGPITFADGWVVVHEANETGQPERALSHQPTDPDRGFQTDVWMALPDETWANASRPLDLVVAIHEDDGNGQFDSGEDPVLESFGTA